MPQNSTIRLVSHNTNNKIRSAENKMLQLIGPFISINWLIDDY